MNAIKLTNIHFVNPNLLDYFMTFNDAFSWTVSSGTGFGIHSTKETATRTHKAI